MPTSHLILSNIFRAFEATKSVAVIICVKEIDLINYNFLEIPVHIKQLFAECIGFSQISSGFEVETIFEYSIN
jgi:hypothetical protein